MTSWQPLSIATVRGFPRGPFDALPNVIPQAGQDRPRKIRQRGLSGLFRIPD
jgi:hypothetical protein